MIGGNGPKLRMSAWRFCALRRSLADCWSGMEGTMGGGGGTSSRAITMTSIHIALSLTEGILSPSSKSRKSGYLSDGRSGIA